MQEKRLWKSERRKEYPMQSHHNFHHLRSLSPGRNTRWWLTENNTANGYKRSGLRWTTNTHMDKWWVARGMIKHLPGIAGTHGGEEPERHQAATMNDTFLRRKTTRSFSNRGTGTYRWKDIVGAVHWSQMKGDFQVGGYRSIRGRNGKGRTQRS